MPKILCKLKPRADIWLLEINSPVIVLCSLELNEEDLSWTRGGTDSCTFHQCSRGLKIAASSALDYSAINKCIPAQHCHQLFLQRIALHKQPWGRLLLLWYA